MRTTIDLPRSLLDKAKAMAERENLTLSQIVERAVRDEVLRAKNPVADGPFRLVTYGEGGLVPGSSWTRLKDVLDFEDGVPRGSGHAHDEDR
jgi:hypothetical protein